MQFRRTRIPREINWPTDTVGFRWFCFEGRLLDFRSFDEVIYKSMTIVWPTGLFALARHDKVKRFENDQQNRRVTARCSQLIKQFAKCDLAITDLHEVIQANLAAPAPTFGTAERYSFREMNIDRSSRLLLPLARFRWNLAGELEIVSCVTKFENVQVEPPLESWPFV